MRPLHSTTLHGPRHPKNLQHPYRSTSVRVRVTKALVKWIVRLQQSSTATPATPELLGVKSKQESGASWTHRHVLSSCSWPPPPTSSCLLLSVDQQQLLNPPPWKDFILCTPPWFCSLSTLEHIKAHSSLGQSWQKQLLSFITFKEFALDNFLSQWTLSTELFGSSELQNCG